MNVDDHKTKLSLKDAGELCGVTEKTLGRDRDERRMEMEMNGGRWWVTIETLIAHGRYKPTDEGVSTRLAKGKADARILSLEADFAEVRLRSEFQTKIIARLEDEVAFLRSHITSLQAVA